MLEIQLNNGIAINLSAEKVKEAINNWLEDNTSFLNDEGVDFTLDFNNYTESEEQSEEEDTTTSEPKQKKRRTRRTKEQIALDAQQEASVEIPEPTKVITPAIAESVTEEVLEAVEAPRDLMQEVIDEIPVEEEQMVLDLVDPIIEVSEPDNSKNEVLDLTQSIFG